jgi:hypothetical protein
MSSRNPSYLVQSRHGVWYFQLWVSKTKRMYTNRRMTVFLLFAVYAQAQESYLVKPDVQGCINVRDNSNTNAGVIGCLSANSPVTVLSSRPDYRSELYIKE